RPRRPPKRRAARRRRRRRLSIADRTGRAPSELDPPQYVPRHTAKLATSVRSAIVALSGGSYRDRVGDGTQVAVDGVPTRDVATSALEFSVEVEQGRLR